jgi:hypothetical protein
VGLTKKRFHHSSFFAGKACEAAGIIVTNQEGRLLRLLPHSGHYRPGEAHLQRTLLFLKKAGLNLKRFDVDLQQIFHVARGEQKSEQTGGELAGGEQKVVKLVKAKKKETLHLKTARYVAAYLAHKALMIGEGVFAQIHKIRTSGAVSVSDALMRIDAQPDEPERAAMSL